MSTFTTIKASEAPQRPKGPGHNAKRKAEYDSYAAQLKANEVGVLVPEDNETDRGLASRIRRAARRLGLDFDTWIVDGSVYFAHAANDKPVTTKKTAKGV